MEEAVMKSIGFIGTGVMGAPMAGHLMDRGYKVSVYNRTKEKAQSLIDKGAEWCGTVAECARNKDIVITIVGYPKDVEEVYFGNDGIIENAKEGAVLIDMTTTSPQLSKRIYQEAAKRGISTIDAPVSGGDTGARNATLAIMAGGDRDAFDKCIPVFEAMGKSVNYVGKAGSGQHVKMANQIAIAGAVSGVCEAIAYSRAMGVDVGTMIKTISGGAAGSWQLLNVGPKMDSGDFAPGFFIKHFIKDMGIACDEAQSAGLELEMLELVMGMYQTLEEKGDGELGTPALIEYYEE
ncbi:MAG: NAD(P)-dependent oxidoreductase [Clostridiaceae bacterium]|nr:NAD(P)-dependent oxidoreductase [Clostridiaceae bacterium]